MKHTSSYKFFFLCAILCTQTLSALSQGKMLTLEDAVLNSSLYPKSLANNMFLPSGDYYCFSNNNKLYIERIDKIITDSAVTLEAINAGLKKIEQPELKNFPRIEWQNDQSFLFQSSNHIYLLNRYDNSVSIFKTLPIEVAKAEWNFNKTLCAYSFENNIHVYYNGKTERITEDGTYGIVYGEAVHRNEFGINKGIFWSPDGSKFAFYRMDETKVTDYFIFDNEKLPAGVNKIKYPFAGNTSHSVKVGIYDVELKMFRYLRVQGAEDDYLTNITWSPDSRFVYVAKVARNQKNMWLERYWVNDGALDKIILEEHSEKYVEPENGPSFLPWDSDLFIWQSERDGFNHLYLYNTNGRLIRQLTSGSWVVTEIKGFNNESQTVYVQGTMDGAIENHLYAVNTNLAKTKKITSEKGVHRVLVNSKGNYFIDHYSSLIIPGKIDLLSESGSLLRNILTSPNPLAGYNLGETSIFPIRNKDVTLYARMIKPPDFNPNRQYPVIVYVYGGPHVQLVKNSWLGASNLWMQFLAQQGFIVFTLDNRGSANRGFAFESAIHKRLGTLEMEDQLAGVEFLKNLPYVDASRIGLHGWSFGGFMTASLMTRSPGVFKVGVAGGPVIDWKMYEIMYTERYMETPQKNNEGYEKANLLNYVENLQEKLLMIHGTDDDVVLWQHSLLYVQEAVKLNKTELDYFVYPKHKHNVSGKDRLHLITKITEYLFDNL